MVAELRVAYCYLDVQGKKGLTGRRVRRKLCGREEGGGGGPKQGVFRKGGGGAGGHLEMGITEQHPAAWPSAQLPPWLPSAPSPSAAPAQQPH